MSEQALSAALQLLLLIGGVATVWKAAVFLTAMKKDMHRISDKLTEHADRVLAMIERHDEGLADHEVRIVQGEQWRAVHDGVRAARKEAAS